MTTVWLPVECPHCHSTEVVKHRKLPVGKQRYRCLVTTLIASLKQRGVSDDAIHEALTEVAQRQLLVVPSYRT